MPKQHFLNEKLTTKDAGTYLNYTEYTMRRARSEGRLAGVESPKYRKIGRRVFYDQRTLDEWLSQFKEQSNTAKTK